ncbi:MAG TPA: B12-binding domain-containing protein, partial [Nitrospinaceae bacterium]|nr:B12-binding domain-containing protein [Nitrospinaceae bacterium]
MTDKAKLVGLIAGMEEDPAVKLSVELMDAGTPPEDILAACREAMDIVGKKFEEGEFFIPELILAGEMLEQIGNEVKPRIKDDTG